MNKFLSALARVLLSLVFLGAVSFRLMAITASPDGYDQYLALLGHFGLPGIFAPLLILIQLAGGLALLTGLKTQLFAYILAGFSLFLAIVLGLSQPDVMLLYLGLTGGLLTLALNPSTAYSLDGLKK
ncbi:MAG TPA: DoxX family membrane protein [Methylophilaceae bacterium]|jgi:putative oxidoreductase